jgi:hypothetical protein
MHNLAMTSEINMKVKIAYYVKRILLVYTFTSIPLGLLIAAIQYAFEGIEKNHIWVFVGAVVISSIFVNTIFDKFLFYRIYRNKVLLSAESYEALGKNKLLFEYNISKFNGLKNPKWRDTDQSTYTVHFFRKKDALEFKLIWG